MAKPLTEEDVAKRLGFIATPLLLIRRRSVLKIALQDRQPGSEAVVYFWKLYAEASEAIVDALPDANQTRLKAQVGALLYKAGILRQLAKHKPTLIVDYADLLREDLAVALEYARNANLAPSTVEAIQHLYRRKVG